MISKVGIHPSAHFRWQRYGLERKFITKSGTDNSLPYSNMSRLEWIHELARRKQLTIGVPCKPRSTHWGLGWSTSYMPQVRPDQILGFDTNTRSAVHQMSNKDTPAIGAAVTFGLKAPKFKSAHNRQGFPTG